MSERAHRPRIGICDPGTAGPGGIHRYVQGLLDGLDPAEFAVSLFCHPSLPFGTRPTTRVRPLPRGTNEPGPREELPPGSRPGPARDRLRELWRSAAPPSAKLVAGFCRSAWQVARVLRGDRLDLLHSMDTDDDPAALAARWAGVRCVLTTYHVDSSYDTRGIRQSLGPRLLERITDACVSRAIAVSHATKRDRLRRTGIAPGRVLTVHNGVDTEAFRRRRSTAEARARLGLPADGRVYLGGVGRLHEHKGFEFLIRALALLAAEVPNVQVVLAGSGPLDDSLARLAQRLGVAERVHFLGQCADVRGVLEALDVFLLPSLCEALPYALLEAMAVGLPAVSTRVGGVPEVVVPGETGFLVPPRDAGAIAAALRPLLDAPELRQRLGGAARERVVRHFQERDMVRRTLQVYRTVLGRPAP